MATRGGHGGYVVNGSVRYKMVEISPGVVVPVPEDEDPFWQWEQQPYNEELEKYSPYGATTYTNGVLQQDTDPYTGDLNIAAEEDPALAQFLNALVDANTAVRPGYNAGDRTVHDPQPYVPSGARDNDEPLGDPSGVQAIAPTQGQLRPHGGFTYDPSILQPAPAPEAPRGGHGGYVASPPTEATVTAPEAPPVTPEPVPTPTPQPVVQPQQAATGGAEVPAEGYAPFPDWYMTTLAEGDVDRAQSGMVGGEQYYDTDPADLPPPTEWDQIWGIGPDGLPGWHSPADTRVNFGLSGSQWWNQYGGGYANAPWVQEQTMQLPAGGATEPGTYTYRPQPAGSEPSAFYDWYTRKGYGHVSDDKWYRAFRDWADMYREGARQAYGLGDYEATDPLVQLQNQLMAQYDPNAFENAFNPLYEGRPFVPPERPMQEEPPPLINSNNTGPGPQPPVVSNPGQPRGGHGGYVVNDANTGPGPQPPVVSNPGQPRGGHGGYVASPPTEATRGGHGGYVVNDANTAVWPGYDVGDRIAPRPYVPMGARDNDEPLGDPSGVQAIAPTQGQLRSILQPAPAPEPTPPQTEMRGFDLRRYVPPEDLIGFKSTDLINRPDIQAAIAADYGQEYVDHLLGVAQGELARVNAIEENLAQPESPLAGPRRITDLQQFQGLANAQYQPLQNQLVQRGTQMGAQGMFGGLMAEQNRMRNTLAQQAAAQFQPLKFNMQQQYQNQTGQLANAIAQAQSEQQRIIELSGRSI